MKKRILAILLTLTMVLTYMPAIAFADETVEPAEGQPSGQVETSEEETMETTEAEQ